MAAVASHKLDKRLSISAKGCISENEIQERHQDTLSAISAKLGEINSPVLTPEQEEVQLGYELAKEAETRLGYGLKYAYVDGTSPYGGSSLVFSNGTGLYAVVDIKYLPDLRDDRKSKSLRAKKLAKVKEAAALHARRFKQDVAGKGTLVWAAVYSNMGGLQWMEQPSMPSDLDEVELLIPSHRGQAVTSAASAKPESTAAGAAGAGRTGGWEWQGWVAGAAAVAAVGVALVRIMAARQ